MASRQCTICARSALDSVSAATSSDAGELELELARKKAKDDKLRLTFRGAEMSHHFEILTSLVW